MKTMLVGGGNLRNSEKSG